MAGTFLGEVSTAQLAGAPQAIYPLTPQASTPAVSASQAQLFAKTDNQLYHEDVTGVVTNLLLPSQFVNSSLGPQTLEVGPFVSDNTSTHQIAYGFSGTTLANLSYVAKYRCSLIGLSATSGTQSGSASGNVALIKNGTSQGNVLATSSAGGTSLGYNYATFNNGVYVFNPGDQLNFTYSGTATSVIIAATLNAGSQAVSSANTYLTGNTTVGAGDNQRVWRGVNTAVFTLTLPATQSTTDFYVNLAITAGAGVTVQALAGQVIYKGASTSSSGGTATFTTVGTYVTLYNAAGTSLWLIRDPSVPCTLA